MKPVAHPNRISYWPTTDWMAYDDANFPDGPVAWGKTPVDAMTELASIYDHDDKAVAIIEAKIEEMTAIEGAPV